MQTTIEATAQPGDVDATLAALSKNYRKELARIDKAIDLLDKKQQELATLAANTPWGEELESILRIKQREADDLRVQGKTEEADQKLKEAEEAAAIPGRLESEYEDCDLQKAELENERRAAARKVLDEWHAMAVQQMIRPQMRVLFAMLERTATKIREFIEQTGNTPQWPKPGGLEPTDYIDSLVPKDGTEGENRYKWFSIVETRYVRRK